MWGAEATLDVPLEQTVLILKIIAPHSLHQKGEHQIGSEEKKKPALVGDKLLGLCIGPAGPP